MLAAPPAATPPWARPGADLAGRYRVAAGEDWEDFLRLLELEENFAPVLFTVPDESGADVLRRWLGESLAARRQEVEEIPARTPEELRLLALRVLEPVGPRAASVRVLWAAAVVGEKSPDFAAWRESWAFALARLNEHRNTMRRCVPQALVLVGAPWLKPLFREVAPDLWSIRSLVLDLAPAPEAPALEPAALSLLDRSVLGGLDQLARAEGTERLRQRVAELRAMGGREELLAPALVRLAEALIGEWNYEEAELLAADAVVMAKDLGLADWRWRAEFTLAQVLAWKPAHSAAGELFERLRREAHEKGEIQREANCLRRLGNIALRRAEHAEARARYEGALPLYRKVGDVQGEANCIESLGDLALRRSEHAEARARYEEAMPFFRRVGDMLGEANCIKSLGDIALRRSEHAEARARFEEALPLYRRVGSGLGEANCIRSLGDIALRRSEHAEARARYEDALLLYRRVGSMLGEANCIQSLGNIALRRSEDAEAKKRYEEAVPHYRRAGDVLGEANCIQSLGDVARVCSEPSEARKRYEEAMPLFRRVGDVLGEANCIRSLGYIALGRSEHAEARARFEEALPLYRRVGNVLGEANCIFALGEVALECSEQSEARGHFKEALRLYERIPDPHPIGWTHRQLAWLEDEESAARAGHVATARRAWESIDRPDLVAGLDKEFGAPPEVGGGG